MAAVCTWIDGAIADASGSTLATAAFANTAGRLLAVHIRYESTTTTTSVADTAGNTYTGLTQNTAAGAPFGRWFYSIGTAAHAANVITVTWGAARTFKSMRIFEFAYDSCTFDVEAQGTTDSATSIATASFDTAGIGLILIGATNYNSDTGVTSITSANKYLMLQRQAATSGNLCNEGFGMTTGALSGATVTYAGSATTARTIEIVSFLTGSLPPATGGGGLRLAGHGGLAA